MTRPAGPDVERRLLAAERSKRVAELKLEGWTYRAIAKELGMSVGGVYDSLNRRIASIGKDEIEEYRAYLKAETERVLRLAGKDEKNDDATVRHNARRDALKAIEVLARVSGVEKVPAPIFQMNLNAGQAQYDLSKLSIDEVRNFKAYVEKMMGPDVAALPPAIEVVGHTVDEPKETDDEGRADSGEDAL